MGTSSEERSRTPGSWLRETLGYAPAAVLAPAAGMGVAALFGRGPRLLRRHRPLAGVLAAGATAALARWQMNRYFTEQPEYTVERRYPGFEVRRYPERAVAETTVEGARWETALGEGFRRLAAYIFGANRACTKLAMTTPVNAAEISERQPDSSRAQRQRVTVTFTMPRTRDLASLPLPIDARVRLRDQEWQRVAVLRSRGTYSRRRKQRMEAKLMRLVEQANLFTAGPAVFAGYDAPWTLPFLRRVELWIPIF